MNPNVPSDIRRLIAQLRDSALQAGSERELFDLVLGLAEHVATHEDRIDVAVDSPEHLLSGADDEALAAASKLLSELGAEDVGRIERLLRRLQAAHGRVPTLEPGAHLLLDATVLGRVAFAYSRRHREVLATSTAARGLPAAGTFESLLRSVDRLFPEGNPRTLWRIGPELGADACIDVLLERGERFVAQSPHSDRAAELAESVRTWQPLAGGRGEIGESLEWSGFDRPVRCLVLRSRVRSSVRNHGLLLTTLVNMPWEEIERLHRGRRFGDPTAPAGRKPLVEARIRPFAATIMVLALLAYRNVNTWAANSGRLSTEPSPVVAASQPELPTVSYLDTPVNDEVTQRMQDVAEWLQRVSGDRTRTLRTVKPTSDNTAYEVPARRAGPVPVLAAGVVVHVGPPDAETGLGSLLVRHEGGVSSYYDRLRLEDLRVGQELEDGAVIGVADRKSPFRFEARMAESYLDRRLEPTLAGLLRPDEHVLLDPLGRLLNKESREREIQAAGAPADAEPIERRRLTEDGNVLQGWNVDESDLFRLHRPDDPMDVAFVANHRLREELPEGGDDEVYRLAGLLPDPDDQS